MSTLGQPVSPAWREEVNRRLAEHKNRKGTPPSTAAPAETAAPGTSRAAQAAARVAARYAQAKSYSQMQAEEARVAVRAAEIATQVAREAQSAAENALAEMHAASVERPVEPVISIDSARHAEDLVEAQSAMQLEIPMEAPAAPEWDWAADQIHADAHAHAVEVPEVATAWVEEPVYEPVVGHVAEVEHVVEQPAAQLDLPQLDLPQPVEELPAGPVTDTQDSSGQLLHIRWDVDMPVRPAAGTPAPEPFELAAEDWWTPAEPSAPHRDEPVEIEAHTIHANLIQFPRELVATRRMRPRLLEPTAAEQEMGTQLSIFEVDPNSIETEAPAPDVAGWSHAEPLHETAGWAEADESAASVITPSRNSASHAASWSTPEMKLDAPAQTEFVTEAKDKPELAPLSTRLMSGMVDTALVGAAATFVWLTLALGMSHNLPIRTAELMGAGVLVAMAVAYHSFFGLLSLSTPGMRYSGISLCTFDDCVPTQEQLRRRLGAMLVATLPLGLGLVWSVFDEDRLSWHDRFSQTYLRKS